VKNRKLNKYIYLLPILICLGFASFFYQVSQHIAEERYRNLFEERKETVNLIAAEVNYFISKDDDWEDEQEFYVDWLLFSANFNNVRPYTISFLMNNRFEIISNTNHGSEDERYAFLWSDNFIYTIGNNSSGTVSTIYNGKDMLVYYRWIPDNQNEQFLFAIAVIPEIRSEFDTIYFYGLAGLILLVLIVNYAMIWKFLKNGGEN